MRFPEAMVFHCFFMSSDHRPIVLKLYRDSPADQTNRPFRFMAAWLTNDSFSTVVHEAWQNKENWTDSCNKF